MVQFDPNRDQLFSPDQVSAVCSSWPWSGGGFTPEILFLIKLKSQSRPNEVGVKGPLDSTTSKKTAWLHVNTNDSETEQAISCQLAAYTVGLWAHLKRKKNLQEMSSLDKFISQKFASRRFLHSIQLPLSLAPSKLAMSKSMFRFRTQTLRQTEGYHLKIIPF